MKVEHFDFHFLLRQILAKCLRPLISINDIFHSSYNAHHYLHLSHSTFWGLNQISQTLVATFLLFAMHQINWCLSLVHGTWSWLSYHEAIAERLLRREDSMKLWAYYLFFYLQSTSTHTRLRQRYALHITNIIQDDVR